MNSREITLDPEFFGSCPRCGVDFHLSDADSRTCPSDTEITLKCPEHGEFEVQAGGLSNDNPDHKSGRLTGKYARLKIAPTTNMGTIGYPIIEHGREEYLFTPDPRIKIAVAPTAGYFVSESELELCERLADEVIEGLNKIAAYGSD